MTWRFWWEHPAKLRTVIVNRKGEPDSAIRGVLWTNKGAWIVLKDAYLLMEGREPQKLDGEIIVERQTIDFIQVLP